MGQSVTSMHGWLVVAVMTPALHLGLATSATAEPTPSQEAGSAQSVTLWRCGWRFTGRLHTHARNGWTMSNVTGKADGWWMSASRLRVEEGVVPGGRLSPGVTRCRLEGSQGIRILAPDGRYITGASLTASGSPAVALTVWPKQATQQKMASVIGDGWRIYGSAIFVDTATGAIRVHRAHSRSSEGEVSLTEADSSR